MENKIRYILNIILGIWGLVSMLYLTVILLPSSFFVDVKMFEASDTVVGGYTYLNSIRDVKWGLGGHVIEEINIVRDDITEVLYIKEREVLTEEGLKSIRRRIEYVHKEPGAYKLHLYITHDIGFGIKKVLFLSADYTVTF